MHKCGMLDWNDLRYFLSVAHNGSTLAAGRALGLSQSTVHRRLAALERCLGQKLVTRFATGYRLTTVGEALLVDAQRVADAVGAFEQRVAEAARDRGGVVRVTCPEPLMSRITQSGLLDRFHAAYPWLRAEFVTSDRYLDLGRGDVDVAMRSGDVEDSDLVGHTFASSLWAVYASSHYVERYARPERIEDLQSHRLIGLDETMRDHRVTGWLNAVAPDAQVVVRANSVLGLVNAVKSGVGVGPLPTALGDAEPDLVRGFGPVAALTRSWRLLAHPSVRRTPRVSAFFDFIAGEKEALSAIFTGPARH